MTQVILNSLVIIIAILSVFRITILIKRILKLNAIFNHAIVLIPLYHKKTWLFVLNFILLTFSAGVLLLAFITELYIIGSAIFIVLMSLIALVVTMITGKFAVLDSGIIVPYRFINFMHLYEYKIEDNKIFFCKDSKGYDTITAITPNLTFSKDNLAKLEYLLNKHINRP